MKRIMTVYMYSKLKWIFSCYHLDASWLKQSCDSLALRYIRKWLNFHPGANTCHLSLPFKKLGVNLTLPSHIYQQCKITVRRILCTSKDKNIRCLYVETHDRNVNIDEIVEKAQTNNEVSRETCKKIWRRIYRFRTGINSWGWRSKISSLNS